MKGFPNKDTLTFCTRPNLDCNSFFYMVEPVTSHLFLPESPKCMNGFIHKSYITQIDLRALLCDYEFIVWMRSSGYVRDEIEKVT